jgi:hypothetical protein
MIPFYVFLNFVGQVPSQNVAVVAAKFSTLSLVVSHKDSHVLSCKPGATFVLVSML